MGDSIHTQETSQTGRLQLTSFKLLKTVTLRRGFQRTPSLKTRGLAVSWLKDEIEREVQGNPEGKTRGIQVVNQRLIPERKTAVIENHITKKRVQNGRGTEVLS